MSRIYKLITEPQKTDMGSGFGGYIFEKPLTLEEFFKFYNNNQTWGKIYIFNNNNKIAELKFDGMHSNEFCRFKPLDWDKKLLSKNINEIKFNYCFNLEDVEIYLGD